MNPAVPGPSRPPPMTGGEGGEGLLAFWASARKTRLPGIQRSPWRVTVEDCIVQVPIVSSS